ncbi:cytochrome C [Campylobacter sp. FMV-PI01]|uniref:Cytochrome C n=1 Tax=Campylobacter portucalensis TaxID=2608384 RepID=A0A6L5WJP3_9BACT|nr:cytochrome C [Campylobacter portucalensis]MSN96063.1 cytochrome C [Campylobacter portucalensis]
MKKIFFMFAIFSVIFANEIDLESGLKIDDGWDIVAANCIACHSANLITNQKATKQGWLDIIRWMQRSEGLWELDPEMENTIISYLAKNYGNKFETRKRLPLLISD